MLAQHGQGLDPVPELGGGLKLQVFRRPLHLGGQLLGELAQLASEETAGLLHPLLIDGFAGTVLPAKTVAFADMIVEAGPLLADVPGKLAAAGGQLQCAAYGIDGHAGLTSPAEGAEVPGTVVGHFAHQREAGIGPLSQPDEGIALIVLQQDVVPGLMVLDEGVLQDQRLELSAHEDGVEVIHLGHHGLCLLVVTGVFLEVLADPVFQFFRLAHVDDLAGLVHH